MHVGVSGGPAPVCPLRNDVGIEDFHQVEIGRDACRRQLLGELRVVANRRVALRLLQRLTVLFQDRNLCDRSLLHAIVFRRPRVGLFEPIGGVPKRRRPAERIVELVEYHRAFDRTRFGGRRFLGWLLSRQLQNLIVGGTGLRPFSLLEQGVAALGRVDDRLLRIDVGRRLRCNGRRLPTRIPRVDDHRANRDTRRGQRRARIGNASSTTPRDLSRTHRARAVVGDHIKGARAIRQATGRKPASSTPRRASCSLAIVCSQARLGNTFSRSSASSKCDFGVRRAASPRALPSTARERGSTSSGNHQPALRFGFADLIRRGAGRGFAIDRQNDVRWMAGRELNRVGRDASLFVGPEGVARV